LPDKFQQEEITSFWELNGPALDAKEGVRFGKVPVSGERAVGHVKGYSAVILEVG
jgi:hypothetical protein